MRNATSDVGDLTQEVYSRLLRIDDHETIRNPRAHVLTVASHVGHQHALRSAGSSETVEMTLSVCGALDRCPPPEEAVQFHNALVEQGVESVLVKYREEGHGVQKFSASIDYAARIVSWFEKHLCAEEPIQGQE